MTKEKDWIIYCPACGKRVNLKLKINPVTGLVKIKQEWTSRISFKQKDDTRKSLLIQLKDKETKLCPNCGNKIFLKFREQDHKRTIEVENGKLVGNSLLECKNCRHVFEMGVD